MNTSKFNIIIPPQDIQENPECLGQIANGDTAAFAWLYKNYCNRLYDYVLLLTNDKTLSEDLVQDTFLKIWTNKNKLHAVTNFNSYLYITAKNLLSDNWRKKQSENKLLKNLTASQQLEEENLYHQREIENKIEALVKTLSPKQELIYRLVREEGRKREEISNLLNLSPNTVKATMQNALYNLKQKLKEIIEP